MTREPAFMQEAEYVREQRWLEAERLRDEADDARLRAYDRGSDDSSEGGAA